MAPSPRDFMGRLPAYALWAGMWAKASGLRSVQDGAYRAINPLDVVLATSIRFLVDLVRADRVGSVP
jgi:hypothetical protein